MFAEDFMNMPKPCPMCHKVLTDGSYCISCQYIKDEEKEAEDKKNE